jgi:hypothetical protein
VHHQLTQQVAFFLAGKPLSLGEIEVVDDKSLPYLYVNVKVTGDAFSIDISFKRVVYYQVSGSMYSTYAATWSTGGTGVTGEGGETYIMDSLDQMLDSFLNEYLAANK